MKKSIVALILAVALALPSFGMAATPNADLYGTHDPVTLINEKGEYRPHYFNEDGQCVMCGETTIFTQNEIASIYKTKVSDEADRGTVTRVEYKGIGEAQKDEAENITGYAERDAVAYVYTPAGYDAADKETKYNVLYMLHGSGLNEGFWFAQGSYNPNKTNFNGFYCTENVLDDLMKTGEAEKTICVSISFNANDGSQNSASCGNAELELKEYLMPFIAKNFNTYAEITEESTPEEIAAELIANRAHHGFVGLSAGSSTSYSLVLGKCLDYIGYVGSYSGASNPEPIIEAINAAAEAGYPLLYWYNGLGTLEKGGDTPWNGAASRGDYPGLPVTSYVQIKDACNLQSGSDVAAGDNCEFVWCNYNGHSYITWITCLYNTMKVFFKAPASQEPIKTYTLEGERDADLYKYDYTLELYEDNKYTLTLVADWVPAPVFNTTRKIVSYGTYTSTDGENGTKNIQIAAPTRIEFYSYGTNLSLRNYVDTANRYSDTAWVEPSEFNPYGYVMYQHQQRAVPEVWASPEEFIAAYGRTYDIVVNADNTMTITVTSHDGVQIDGYNGIDKTGMPIVLEQ